MYTAVSSGCSSIHVCDFLQARAVGVIPYLGTFLTDLTMTHSAFHDTLHVREAVSHQSLVINHKLMNSLWEEW